MKKQCNLRGKKEQAIFLCHKHTKIQFFSYGVTAGYFGQIFQNLHVSICNSGFLSIDGQKKVKNNFFIKLVKLLISAHLKVWIEVLVILLTWQYNRV